MALDTQVIPGLTAALQTAVDVNGNSVFASIDVGYTFDIGASPAVWLTVVSFSAPENQGSELEVTDWNVEVKVLYEWAPDQHSAEAALTALIEPVRAVLRPHMKMGQVTIARARVASGTFGWIQVNEIWYRTVDILVAVREKETRSYGV